MASRANSLLWFVLAVLLLAFITGCEARIEQASPVAPAGQQRPTLAAGETPQPQLLERRLLAQPSEINAVTVLGMPGDLVRILGMLGVFISTVIGYPFIQKWIESIRDRKKPPRAGAARPEEVTSPSEPDVPSGTVNTIPGTG